MTDFERGDYCEGNLSLGRPFFFHVCAVIAASASLSCSGSPSRPTPPPADPFADPPRIACPTSVTVTAREAVIDLAGENHREDNESENERRVSRHNHSDGFLDLIT